MAGLTSTGKYSNEYIRMEENALAHIDNMIFKAQEDGDAKLVASLEQEWQYRVSKLDEYCRAYNKKMSNK